MISPRTKAILTPNLVGNCPDWDEIRVSPTSTACWWSRIRATCSARGFVVRGTGLRADIVVTSFARRTR